jgi:hypothetical protein
MFIYYVDCWPEEQTHPPLLSLLLIRPVVCDKTGNWCGLGEQMHPTSTLADPPLSLLLVIRAAAL